MDDFNPWVYVGIGILLLLVVWLASQRTVSVSNFEGDVKVYGSNTCPWCVKQKEYLDGKSIKYEFIDCTTSECPEFVSGFPTLVVNGEVKSGYTEL